MKPSLRNDEDHGMKTRRSLFASVVLSLAAVIAGAMVWGDTAALAVPAATRSTIVIQLAGTVDGPPESVFLSGNVQIKAIVVPDPDFNGPPAVVISIDFLNVDGVGATTGTRYVAPGEHEYIRRLVATDQLDITFPFLPRGGDILSARSGIASLSLSFDANGRLAAATGTIVTSTLGPNV